MIQHMADQKDEALDKDQVDGGLNTVKLEREEDFLVAMLYIADCFSLGRTPDLECVNVKRQRERIVDVLLRVADCS